MVKQTMLQMGFWTAWLVIPALFELIPAAVAWWRNRRTLRHERKTPTPGRMPELTVIMPVYNSADTLFAAIASVANSTYPNELVTVICANNMSTDNSFAMFQKAQSAFPKLRLQWLSTQQGKARALNSAIYNSLGDYVITMDSDGTLEPRALMNMVLNFIAHPDVQAQTGTILSNRNLIAQQPKHRLLHLNEYMEYAITFLAGRTIESQDDEIFTMSGAFSAFRRSALMQSRLYNVDTVGEDTDMTFQIRYYLQGKIRLCPDAVFYVEPVSGWDQLYVQRQRWQRGEIEVIRAFLAQHISLKELWSNFVVRRLIVDHTVNFLKIVWLFAIFILVPFGYSAAMIALSFVAMYLLYLFIGILNWSNVLVYLKFDRDEQRYCRRHGWILLTLPFYNVIVSFFRGIGVINTSFRQASWRTTDMTTERHEVWQVIRGDWHRLWHSKEGKKN